ncbi:MAG: TIGR01777 family oxidoreductase, partial [Thermoanaerobaculia bacterium]|nr:TIGR01777 family oxidoreductase [Thermoanaerobaculia bacterium]
LVRQRETAPDEVRWDPEAGVLQPDRLEGLDAVVHLAGENIAAGRWTDARKEAILRSRIRGTSNLVASLRDLETPPRAFLCASAVGFYGETGSDERTEEAGRGEGFLSDVCVAWEAAAGGAAELAERVALLRFGVVLSPRGGALAKMLPAFRFGAGGVVGSGRQYLSWISLDDVARAILHALVTPEVEGPLNVVAPQPCTNRELTHQVGSVLRRPTIAPLPRPAVRALFGEMGEAMLLGSTRVAPAKLVQTGFAFAHSELEDCLRHCLGRATPRNAFERAAGLNDQEAT